MLATRDVGGLILIRSGLTSICLCRIIVELRGSNAGLPAAPWFGGALVVLAFPCVVIGLLAMPLCGAALTFFVPQGLPSGRRRKESKQRKRACNR